jgi:TolB-like protein
MASSGAKRRLAAIMSLDVVGYSRLIGEDEAGTLAALRALRNDVVRPELALHGGRPVKWMGDGLIAEFPSIVQAVECAVAIQEQIAARGPEAIRLRIGVTLGDVVVEAGDLLGDGVNVAARLQGLAEPGGIAVSGPVREELGGKLSLAFSDGGAQQVKNIARPVHVWRWTPGVEPDLAAAAGVAVTLPGRPSIAVLPFNNLSADPEQEFFADGITEDIITALSRLRGFLVIARNSTFVYKGRAADVREVGRDLGVRYVLEGSVRKGGERIRVTAQLIEAITGNHLWAERYDRQLEDIFVIQDEITASVVGRIGSELMAAEHERARRKPPQSLDAWECFIRALFKCSLLSEEASRDALALLRRAIELDPGYARAQGLLAWTMVWRAFQGFEPMDEALKIASAAIARGLAADRDEPWPHVAQTMVGLATRDDSLSTTSIARAVALSPNLAYAHGLQGLVEARCGRAAEALVCINRAVRLSPRDMFREDFDLFYSIAHFSAERYDEGLRFAQLARKATPGHAQPILMGCVCAAHLGELETAANLLADLRALVPPLSLAWVEATTPFALAADRARIAEGLRRAGLE